MISSDVTDADEPTNETELNRDCLIANAVKLTDESDQNAILLDNSSKNESNNDFESLD